MDEYRRKKADGTFVPPEVVPKAKGKPGPKPKTKLTETAEHPVVKEEVHDEEAESIVGSESMSVPEDEEIDSHHDHVGEHDQDDGAASDFEDLDN